MVDVGEKPSTDRRAVARATVRMSAATATIVAAGDAPKGDVLGTARIAGIQAAKRTAELIPLCHPLPLSFVDVRARVEPEGAAAAKGAAAAEAGALDGAVVLDGAVTVEAEARTRAPTGVEMEAMTACSVAALTVYDMVKGVERGVEITDVVLVEKSGGRHDWRREDA